MTLAELIEALGGKLVEGSPEFVVHSVNSSALAGPSELIFAEDAASTAEALASTAGAVVIRTVFAEALPHFEHKHVVETDQPRLWFARAAKLLAPVPPATGVHPAAVIGAQVELGEAGAVVGERVRIGEYCRIYPRAVLYPGTTLGDRIVVHAGAVLGADGFGYVRDSSTGAYTQFPQQGTLVIEDDVEIGANTTIDRGALRETRIRRGTKTDNLVHVAHNCDIGEDVILVALAGISGSCTVGNGAVIAGQVGIGDHAHIGPGVILGGQAGVFSGAKVTNEGLKPGTVLWGTPARPLTQVLREQAVLARLAKGSRKTPGRE
jgi:UDP-3-O-[3-hydroxymyristoyl] glucosamine N-acyltransferase